MPADIRILESGNLRIQESALTGESEPIEKETAALQEENSALGDRRNMSFMGTSVTYGRGVAAVVGQQGESSAPVALTCTGALGEYVLALPRGEPLWLVVHFERGVPNPYYSPAPSPPPVTIDELAFL